MLSRDAIEQIVPTRIIQVHAVPSKTRELDQLTEQARRLLSDAAVTWWKTGKVLARIHDTDAFRARYDSWEEYVRNELEIGVYHTRSLMRVAREFREERAVRIGLSKCIWLVKANEEDRPLLASRAERGDLATAAQVRDAVVAANRRILTGANGKSKTVQQSHVRVKLGPKVVASLRALSDARGSTVEDLVAEAVTAYLSRIEETASPPEGRPQKE